MDIELGQTKLTIHPATQKDVWDAFEKVDGTFPERDIAIGDLSAQYGTQTIPLLSGDSRISLSASFTAGGSSGLSVYTSPADAIKSLNLDSSQMPPIPASPSDRFLLLSFAAQAQATANGSVPIGVVAVATFGVKAGGSTLFALLYRFDKSRSARDVVQQAFKNIKLPNQVRTADDVDSGAWIIAEVDGSLQLAMGAQVGYDYKYTRDLPASLTALQFSNDLSVTVDAAAEVTVGYNVSGRYFVVVGRPSLAPDQQVDLVVSKGGSYGYNFGLNLSAGVQMSRVLPSSGRDLVAASFGLYGPQIVADVADSLGALEAWSNGDLAENTAALTISTAKKLLTATTGINADAEFAKATGVLKHALTEWNALVGEGSNELQTLAWKALGNPAEKDLIVKILTDLRDKPTFDKAVSDALQFISGQNWLHSIAEFCGAGSVLSLAANETVMKEVRAIAGSVVDVLSGESSGVLGKLQTYISDRFRLLADEQLHAVGVQASDPVGDALAAATDPGKLNDWLRDRLASILKKDTLLLSDLQTVQKAVGTFFVKFNDLYAKTTDALTKKYNFTFAAAYGATTNNSALLNLSFDLATPAAALFTEVLDGNTSAVFRLQAPEPGLTIRGATMSHGIHQTATTNLTIPFLATASADITTSVAQLTFEQNGANLVGYLSAENEVDRSRYTSILKLTSTLGMKAAALTSIDSSLSYELRAVARNASRSMVLQTTKNFVSTYLDAKLPGNTYADVLATDFDNAVPQPTGNFGDMLMSMQLAVDGNLLSSWIVAKDQLPQAKLQASKVVQRYLREYTHRLYFTQENGAVDAWDVQALLAWESFPVFTGIDWNYSSSELGATNTGKDFYLSDETPTGALLQAMIKKTIASNQGSSSGDWGQLPIRAHLAYLEMIDKGISNPRFVSDSPQSAASHIFSYVSSDPAGILNITALALAEQGVVKGVAKALSDLSAASDAISTKDPSKLIDVLANFGAALTKALNQDTTNIFAPGLHAFGPMLFVELTKALAGTNPGVRSKAMLELKSLKPQHAFDMGTYLKGTEPPLEQIGLSQTIVNV